MPSPYIPNTPQERGAMLQAIGAASVDDLFIDIPNRFRHPTLNLPPPLSELELTQELAQLAEANWDVGHHACFLGAGAYHHFVPSVVRHLTGRGEFYTAYTPYQPEISQGTLQTIYEYQSLVCLLTGMDVSNAGMYDGPTALAEAGLMANRVTGRDTLMVAAHVNPTWCQVVQTYAGAHSLRVERTADAAQPLPTDAACVMVQSPNFLGCIEDLSAWKKAAHAAGAMLIVATDPIALGLLNPPGAYHADIVVAEGQSLGSPPNFGGPYLGIFACKQDYLRQMPGRIVGRTVDVRGQVGYVLTLQTREQHIRRERATSNICTNEALVALAATVYLAALGKKGLRHIAELCYHKAHYAADQIRQIPGYAIASERPFFKEFVVHCPVAPRYINEALLEAGIVGGLDVEPMVPNGVLLCVTEMNTKAQIDVLIHHLRWFAR